MHEQHTSYQVIPRKFRPQTFEAVVGQEAIVTTLKNALRFNRLAHAYLFCGCRGTGKTTLARVFAKALNCQTLTADLEPCNTCPSCTEIMSGRSLDVLEIDGASNRGIDDIRQINETIGYAPSSGKFKIYIIDEVHMLTKEAFNALLKTLEEPPANVKFFFATTEPHKVLPTIISRCQRFDLNRIPQAAMQEKLEKIASELNVNCTQEALSLISLLSEGSLRDAESLFDQVICYAEQPITADGVSHTLGLMPKESFFALDKAIAEHNLSFAFELSQTLFSSGKDLTYFLDNLLEHFRTMLLVKFAKPCFFLNASHERHYSQAAAFYTEEQCLYILDYLIQWQQQIAKSPFKRIGLEMILLHLIRSKNRITFGTLVRRLEELQNSKAQPISSTPVPQLSNDTAPAQSEPSQAAETSTEPMKTEELITAAPTIPPVEQPEVKLKTIDEAPVSVAHIENDGLKTSDLKKIQPDAQTPKAEKELPVKKRAEKKQSEPLLQQQPQQDSSSSSIEEMLLNKVKAKLSTSETSAKSEEEKKTEQPKTPAQNLQSRYETIIRFAAVELEGIIKN